MRLYVGGRCQGKTAYVAAQTGLDPVCCTPAEAMGAPAINCLHLTLRQVVEEGGTGEAFAKALLAHNPGAVVVCDEIGLGVVPLDPFERRWREETGRALCLLAAAAERVERVICGLGQRLK
mgnify:CR=1 FL=1